MDYTHEDVEQALRLAHELTEAWRDQVARVRIELHGTVPEPVFDDHVRLALRARFPEDCALLDEAGSNLDSIRADMELRMVEAHEWFKRIQEHAEN